jgi:hypothetical protein
MWVCGLSYPAYKRMRRIMLSYVAYLAILKFSTLPRKRKNFREKVTEYKICVFWFYLQMLCITLPIVRRTQRDMIRNVWSACNVPFLVRLLVKFNFWQTFENCLNIKLNENPSCGSKVVPCGQTYTDRHDKAISLSSLFWGSSYYETKVLDFKFPPCIIVTYAFIRWLIHT